MGNLPEAFKLLVVGMLTVFCILLIVIYFGKLLIVLVNKYAPEEVVKPAKTATLKTTPTAAVDQQTMSIIQAAVSQLTGGKGTVSKVEKVS